MDNSNYSRKLLADNAPHLLLIDDDSRIRVLLSRFLMENGFRITAAESAESAQRTMGWFIFDLLVLDVMMPGESGVQFALKVRKLSQVPILMLSAKSEMEDRIVGLESGVDDYLPKPFEPRELLLRINAILKRSSSAGAEKPKEIKFGRFVFNTKRKILKRDGELVRLTERESEILALFMDRIGEIVPRENIVPAGKWVGDRTTDVQINRLRRKIEVDPKNPEFLQTVRGIGYRFFTE